MEQVSALIHGPPKPHRSLSDKEPYGTSYCSASIFRYQRSTCDRWISLICGASSSLARLIFNSPGDNSSNLYFFDQPGHVLSHILYGADGFLILLHFFRAEPVAHVPVGRARHDHAVYEEEIVQLCKGEVNAGPAGYGNCGAGLMLERPGLHADVSRPIEQRHDLGRRRAEIDRAADDDAVRLHHFRVYLLEIILYPAVQ